MALTHQRVEFATAQAFVSEHHRHHTPPVGHLFSLGAYEGERLCGVAIVGRPVARHRDDGFTAEITRLCTDGTRNACSFLLGKAAKAALALGFETISAFRPWIAQDREHVLQRGKALGRRPVSDLSRLAVRRAPLAASAWPSASARHRLISVDLFQMSAGAHFRIGSERAGWTGHPSPGSVRRRRDALHRAPVCRGREKMQ